MRFSITLEMPDGGVQQWANEHEFVRTLTNLATGPHALEVGDRLIIERVE